MAKSCVYIPQGKQQSKLFLELKEHFGRPAAAYIYNRVITEPFIDKYRDSLTLVEGVPTYQSVISNPLVKKYLGKRLLDDMNKRQVRMDDTFDNVHILMSRAVEYNTNNPDYIAYVDKNEDGTISLHIDDRNEQSIEIAESQRKIHDLNTRIANMLSSAGVTIGKLSEIETSLGRVGVTNFNHLTEVIGNFSDIIKIANNMEGYNALSEEFAHFIVGVNRNKPLVTRSIKVLTDEDRAKEVLGEQYQDVYDFYDGDAEAIAEEALGHLLRNEFVVSAPKTSNSLFKRAIDFIVGLFKGYNPAYVNGAIEYAKSNMNELSRKYLEENKRITRKDILKSEREIEFNALSEKEAVQMDKLKKMARDVYAWAKLIDEKRDVDSADNLKRSAYVFAKKVDDIVTKVIKNEETVEALYQYILAATKELNQYYTELCHLNEFDRKGQSSILRNTQFTLQAFKQGVNEVRDMLTSEFLEDPDIAEQVFVIGDTSNQLAEYETTEEEKTYRLDNIKSTINAINSNSAQWVLSQDGTYYRNKKKNGIKAKRVTSVISTPEDRAEMNSDNPWHLPSTNIGTGIDEMVRDFLGGEIIRDENGHFTVRGEELDAVYPNANRESLNKFAEELYQFKQEQEAKGITFLTRDVTASGIIKTLDNNGHTHDIRVAGTTDLLGYDKNGKWHLFDIKTFRTEIDSKKAEKYTRQISLYKKLLEDKFGIDIIETAILPVNVSYPTPKGDGGSANYTINTRKSKKYRGAYSNQLQVNGEDFKGANPEKKDLMPITPEELNIKFEDLQDTPMNGVATIMSAVETASRQLSELDNLYTEKVYAHVEDMFTGVLGDYVDMPEVDEKGKLTGETTPVSIKEMLMGKPIDNTILQRFLVSYANNPDPFVQAMDFLAKRAKRDKRQRVIDFAQRAQTLAIKYEKLGVRSYDWMFEDDKQNYINHIEIDGVDYSYDGAAYKKAKQKLINELDEKYGEHPRVGSTEYQEKNKELNKWINDHTTEVELNGKKQSIPLHDLFPSRYETLTDAQKDFYDEWMDLKEELDSYIGNSTWLTNTIKVRKSGYQRLTSFTDPDAIRDFVDNTKARFIKSYDDDMNYASATQDFDGNEINRLPLFYLHAKDASDITTDVIGSLIAYSDMVYGYDAMNDIVDSMELVRNVARERGKNTAKTVGGNTKIDKIPYKSGFIEKTLTAGDTSVFMQIVEEFMDDKVYGKYLEDRGNIHILGKETNIDKQKFAGWILRIGSMYQLGFNEIAHLANYLTGSAMQRIEGIAGEHFSMRSLRRARLSIIQDLPQILSDAISRVKKSKIMLLAEHYNFKQDFSQKMRNKDFQNRLGLLRVFGPRMQFLGQELGDFVLYTGAGLAMLNDTKVLDKHGNEISLIDAWREVPIDPSNPEAGNKLVLEEGIRNLDGTAYTADSDFAVEEEIHQVNQNCFGIYNEEDSLAARRYILGRFLLQYRDYAPAQYHYRFGKKKQVITKGKEKNFEGYYRTYGRYLAEVASELKAGQFRLGQVYNSLDDWEKANIIRARAESIQLIFLYLTGMFVKGLKDKAPDKDSKWRKILNYWSLMVTREKTELGALAAIRPLNMAKEALRVAKSPAAVTDPISDALDLTKLLNPMNYTDEIERGRYKGHSTAYKTFMESPATLWYHTISRQLDPEQKEKFYKQ